jgi:hypothetical protein
MSSSVSGAYQACQQKFTDHVHAIRPCRREGHLIQEMVLISRHEDEFDFSVLTRHGDGPATFYSLCSWPDGDGNTVIIGHDEAISLAAAEVLTGGVPLPRHGSLFGWSDGDAFTALIPAYTDATATSALPSWSVMPLAGIAETQWPPFVDERYFGAWFWDDLRAGRLVSLATLVAETPDTVFWADTKNSLGSDTCVVARDVANAESPMLRRGAYVYAGALRAGLPIPSLADLLADVDTIDIAEFFALPDKPGSNGSNCGDPIREFHD